MSKHEDDEPVLHVRRKTALPARYEEYDLSGFTLPRLFPEPMSPHSQFHPTVLPSQEPKDSAAGITPQPLLRKEPDSPQQWSDDEPLGSETSVLKRENRDLMTMTICYRPCRQFSKKGTCFNRLQTSIHMNFLR